MIQRLLITGHINAGKSLLVEQLTELLPDWQMMHTDDTIPLDLSWAERLVLVKEWLTKPAPWVITGVMIPAAVNLYFKDNPEPPADLLIFLKQPLAALTSRQQTYNKTIDTMYQKIRCRVPVPTYSLAYCTVCQELIDAKSCEPSHPLRVLYTNS